MSAMRKANVFYDNELAGYLTESADRLAIPDEQEEYAININGKKDRLSRADFDQLAEYLNMPVKVRYEKFDRKFEAMKKLIRASRFSKADQDKFLDIIKERLRRLGLSE